jgi:hypothetical protein
MIYRSGAVDTLQQLLEPPLSFSFQLAFLFLFGGLFPEGTLAAYYT